MALNKNDLLLLLTEMQEKGMDVKPQINTLVHSSTLPIEVLKFINKQKPLEIVNFYEHMRYNHNHKKSNLYGNIVKEIDEPQEVLSTLSALLTQIILWSKNVDDKTTFLNHSRASEISAVLLNYFKTYDITQALTLLKLVKADIKCLESIK